MKKILFLLLSFVSLSASAANYSWGGYNGVQYSTPLAACESLVAHQAGWVIESLTAMGSFSFGCNGYKAEWNQHSNVGTVGRSGDGCTAPAVVNSQGGCTVPPPPDCAAGDRVRTTYREGTGPLGSELPTSGKTPLPTSDGVCKVNFDKVEKCYATVNAAGTGLDYFCDYSGTKTGDVVPAGSSDPAPSAPSSEAPKTPTPVPPFNPAQGQGCPAGTVNLGIDSTGGSICGGSGASPSEPTKTEVKQPTTNTTNADGSTTKVESTTRTNTDGSTTTTTTTTTTGVDGKVTTTQSSATGAKPSTSGGGSGKDDSSDDKKDDFCLKHPELNICKNSQVTGTCEETACEGDAIQCAILRQQRKEYCENTKTNPISTLGTQVLNGTDPVQDPFKTPTNVGVGNFNFGDLLGGRTCPPDAVIPLWDGGQFEISYKPICDFAAIMRPILIACASFAALYFVIGVL